MPNVLLSTYCNLSCKFCFAQEKLTGKRMHMPIANARQVIDFLKRSQYPVFRLMGGEPTLHPSFTEIVRMGLEEGLRVDVLSNATWPEPCSDLFARVAPTHLLFLLNIDHPDRYPAGLWQRIERNLAVLQGRPGVTLSFNVFEKEPRSDYVLDLASRFGFKNIRLSLSLPVYNAENIFLPIEELHEVAPFVMRFAEKAVSLGVNVQFDNAVPLCMFTEQQAGRLLLQGVLDLKRNTRCEPIIDIGPDLTVWSCFCLSQIANRSLSEFSTLAEAKDYYYQVWSVYQDVVYPMEKCSHCLYREKWGCQGGCLTYSISSDHGQRYAQIPSRDGGSCFNPESCLALADDVILLQYDLPVKTSILRKTSAEVDFVLDEKLQPMLPWIDGRHNTRQLVQRFLDGGNGSGRLQAFVQSVAAESLPEIFAGLVRQGFLKQISNEVPQEDSARDFIPAD